MGLILLAYPSTPASRYPYTKIKRKRREKVKKAGSTIKVLPNTERKPNTDSPNMRFPSPGSPIKRNAPILRAPGPRASAALLDLVLERRDPLLRERRSTITLRSGCGTGREPQPLLRGGRACGLGLGGGRGEELDGPAVEVVIGGVVVRGGDVVLVEEVEGGGGVVVGGVEASAGAFHFVWSGIAGAGAEEAEVEI